MGVYHKAQLDLQVRQVQLKVGTTSSSKLCLMRYEPQLGMIEAADCDSSTRQWMLCRDEEEMQT